MSFDSLITSLPSNKAAATRDIHRFAARLSPEGHDGCFGTH
jgi:hypothetical protein